MTTDASCWDNTSNTTRSFLGTSRALSDPCSWYALQCGIILHINVIFNGDLYITYVDCNPAMKSKFTYFSVYCEIFYVFIFVMLHETAAICFE